jgi:hypothetical protein
MDTIRKLEAKVAELYETMPHLPLQGRKWLAANIWWLTLVGVILGAMGLFGIILATFFASAALTIYGGLAGAAIGGFVFVAALAVTAFMAITIVICAMAITPLKVMRKQGWTLLFIATLVQVAEHVVSFLFNFNLVGLVISLFFTAIGVYFLFEIRDFFGKTSVKSKVPFPTTAPKADTK